MGASSLQIVPAIVATGDLASDPSDDAASVVRFGMLPASTTTAHSAIHYLITEAAG